MNSLSDVELKTNTWFSNEPMHVIMFSTEKGSDCEFPISDRFLDHIQKQFAEIAEKLKEDPGKSIYAYRMKQSDEFLKQYLEMLKKMDQNEWIDMPDGYTVRVSDVVSEVQNLLEELKNEALESVQQQILNTDVDSSCKVIANPHA